MNPCKTLRLAACLLPLALGNLYAQGIAPSAPAQAGTPENTPTPAANRWEIGTRITHYIFRDDRKGRKFEGSFLGSLYEIKDDQDYRPTKLYAQYFFTPRFGAGAAYEHVEAYTWDGGGSDGTVELDGVLLYAVARLPEYDLVRPFAELGIAFFRSSFDYDPVWYDDGIHIMELDDSIGLTAAIGAELLFTEHWSAHALLRYTQASVDATVYTTDIKTEEGTFIMDHFTLGLGAKYSF